MERTRRWCGLVALGVGLTLAGCEAPAQDTAPVAQTVELRFGLSELYALAAWRANSFELRLSLAQRDGTPVAETTVLSEFNAGTAEATLPCPTGPALLARAELIGAYPGRPRTLRGADGGVALPIHYEATTWVRCIEGGTQEVYWPTEDRPEVEAAMPTDPWGELAITLTLAQPEALAERQVVVWWALGSDDASVLATGFGLVPLGQPSWMVGPVNALHTARACTTAAGATTPVTVRAEALLVLVDGEVLPRDAWEIAPVEAEVTCTAGEMTEVTLESALDLNELEVTP